MRPGRDYAVLTGIKSSISITHCPTLVLFLDQSSLSACSVTAKLQDFSAAAVCHHPPGATVSRSGSVVGVRSRPWHAHCHGHP